MIQSAAIARAIALRDLKWTSPFQPQRSDPDLRPVPLGFLVLIVAGACALMLPQARVPGESLSWLNAFFLSTSAVCVTGLTPVNIALTLSTFGHAILLILIQLGGLGIVTASLAMVILGGRRLTLANESAIAATIGRLQRARPADLFRFSCLVIFLVEALGAALLYWRLESVNPQADPVELIWQAAFHSISAFCNAGFSIFPDGLIRWRDDPILLGVVDLMVIGGGIGLLSLVNLRYFQFWRRNPQRRGRLTLQTKLAASMTLILLVIGAGVTLLFEWQHTLSDVSVGQKISWALFHSTMLRTAGFSVVDLAEMHPATLAMGVGLMFVGGSPGSMAGGIKTVTLAVLFATARAALSRNEVIEIFNRRVDSRTVGIALMVSLLALAIAGLGAMALMSCEYGNASADASRHWMGIVFEAFSAFGTVGLSTGVTPLLTSMGKIVVIALMFLGRVTPLMLAVYLARPVRRRPVRYAQEDVAIG